MASVNLTLNISSGSYDFNTAACYSKCASSYRVLVSGCSSTLMWCSTICCKQVHFAVLRGSSSTGTFLEGHSLAILTSLLDISHIYPPASFVSTAALSLPVDLSISGILDQLLITTFVILLVFIHFLFVSLWCFNLSFKYFWSQPCL